MPSNSNGSQVSLLVELRGFLYGFYERRLLSELAGGRIPKHIGVMVDGNRRWAKQFNAPTSQGHQAGADKIHEFLGWCQELGVKVVTLYMLSTDNMSRSSEELDLLMGIIANTLDRLDEDANISVNAMGAPELLPDYLAERLNKLTARTPVREKIHVNVAVGYGGRREI
ncbi:MAG TPA: polyprenyl diphosphate synthase, partial [Gemmatimonadales bacterium]|nr:polyprenyl diphosphate synthase [Gemmatimonadales bacterium]